MKEKNYKKELISLTKSVAKFLTALDIVMREPSSPDRGRKVAKLSNFLEIENDGAMHFGLGWGWKKIGNVKKKSSQELVKE